MMRQPTYQFDSTLDGLLTAVFDSFARRETPAMLVGAGGQLPLFSDQVYRVITDQDKARRVWAGLERRLPAEAVSLIAVSYLSERPEIDAPLFRYLCKVFRQPEGARGMERNFADADVLCVTRMAQRVMHERLRMMQFVRFQKAKDGTYLAVVSPDHNVLPLVVDHFRDRFGDQPWLLYDARRGYGYHYDLHDCIRITFDRQAPLAFNTQTGQLSEDALSENDRLLQSLWKTYFKAICIRERINPRKQDNDMPRRYRRYLTEMQ